MPPRRYRPNLLRAGELTAVWVPDARHEAVRDLVPVVDAGVKDYKSKRENVSSLLLRLGLYYLGKKTWGPSQLNWLTCLKPEHRDQGIAFEEMMLAVGSGSRGRSTPCAKRSPIGRWRRLSKSLQAMRGMDIIGAITFLA